MSGDERTTKRFIASQIKYNIGGSWYVIEVNVANKDDINIDDALIKTKKEWEKNISLKINNMVEKNL